MTMYRLVYRALFIWFILNYGIAQESRTVSIWDIPIDPTGSQDIFSPGYVNYPNASHIRPAYNAYMSEIQKWKGFAFNDVDRIASLTRSDPLLSFLARSMVLFKKQIVHEVPLNKTSLESMLFEVMIQDWANSRPIHLCLANYKDGLFQLESPVLKYYPIMVRTIRPEHCDIALPILHRYISEQTSDDVAFGKSLDSLRDAIAASFANGSPADFSHIIALLQNNENAAGVPLIYHSVALGLGLSGAPIAEPSERFNFHYRIGQFLSGRKTYGELGEQGKEFWNHISTEMMWTYGERMIISPEMVSKIQHGAKKKYLEVIPRVHTYFSSAQEPLRTELDGYPISNYSVRPILMYLASPFDFNKIISAIDAAPRFPDPRVRNIYLVAKKCPAVDYNQYKLWVDGLQDPGEREAALIGWIRAEHSQDESEYFKDLSLARSVTSPAGTVLAFRALAKKWRLREHDTLMRLMREDSTNEYAFTGIGLGCISSTMDDVFLY